GGLRSPGPDRRFPASARRLLLPRHDHEASGFASGVPHGRLHVRRRARPGRRPAPRLTVPRGDGARRRPAIADLLRPGEGRGGGGAAPPAIRGHPDLPAVMARRRPGQGPAHRAHGRAAQPPRRLGVRGAAGPVPTDQGRGRGARHGAGRPRGPARHSHLRVRGNRSARRPAVKFPHPLTLLCGCVLLAAVASHVLPAGQYDRRADPATGRRIVVAGTYHSVAARPVGAFQTLVAVAMSLGAAAVGAASSPITPFQVGIAQQLAQLPLLSGWLFRIAFLAAALGIWVWGTLAYAARTRTTPTTAPDPTAATLDGRRGAVLALVLVSFAALVVGVLRFGWGFNEMAALFFAMGVIAGLVGGLGVGGTAEALVAGFRSMAYAALLIGFARAIFVTLEEGRIVDTIVHGLFTPVAQLPLALAALG